MPNASPAVFLASASPRRQDLLRQAGVAFSLLAPDPQEDSEALEVVLPAEPPADYVRRVTRLKADAALQRLRRRLPDLPAGDVCLLCADTTVALGDAIFGKPVDAADAARMLSALSGTRHAVHTAVCVRRGEALFETVQTSLVQFAELGPDDIADYIATGEPFGKAGAYAMQGRAGAFVVRIEGSPSGIIGLPLHDTLRLLRAAGWRATQTPSQPSDVSPP